MIVISKSDTLDQWVGRPSWSSSNNNRNQSFNLINSSNFKPWINRLLGPPCPLCHICNQTSNNENHQTRLGINWLVGPFCHVCCDHQTSNNQNYKPGINRLVGTLCPLCHVCCDDQTSNSQNHQPGINWLVCSLPASVTAHTKQLRSILCRPVEKHAIDLVIIEEVTKNIWDKKASGLSHSY